MQAQPSHKYYNIPIPLKPSPTPSPKIPQQKLCATWFSLTSDLSQIDLFIVAINLVM